MAAHAGPPLWAVLGYAGNPFQSRDADAQRAAPIPRSEYAALAAAEWRVAEILGESGAGKTTCLHWLRAHFEARGLRVRYEYIHAPDTAASLDPNAVDLLLIDEAERAGPEQLRRLLRGRARVAAGTHTGVAQYAPSGVEVRTLMLGLAPFELASDILRRALAASGAAAPVIDEDILRVWYEAAAGNLLRMDMIGYELFQSPRRLDEWTPDWIRAQASRLWQHLHIKPV